MDSASITLAMDKKYSEFADEIKGELKGKLSSHPVCVQYADDIDSIQSMKSTFVGINQSDEE